MYEGIYCHSCVYPLEIRSNDFTNEGKQLYPLTLHSLSHSPLSLSVTTPSSHSLNCSFSFILPMPSFFLISFSSLLFCCPTLHLSHFYNLTIFPISSLPFSELCSFLSLCFSLTFAFSFILRPCHIPFFFDIYLCIHASYLNG